MKKVVAIGLCIAMCVMMILCVVPAAVSANTSITVSGTYQNGVLSVSWNETLPEGYALTKIKVGSVTKSGSYTGNKADISVSLRPGNYNDAECVFTGPGESITSKFSLVIPTGSVAIKTFEIEQYPSGSRKGRVKIRDEFGEIPVGLKLTISGTEGSSIEVGKGNYTSFDIPEDMDSIKLDAESQTVNYEGYSILFEQASSDTLKVQLSPEEQLGFKFDENHRSFNADSGTLQVTWNADSANGTDVVAVVVNGKTYSVVSDYNGGFTADLSSLAPGHYDMSYVFHKTSGTEVTLSVNPLVRGGTLSTELSVKVENNKITAILTDKVLKRPVANADVKLRIGQTDFPAKKTDKNGKVVFNNAPPSDVSTVLCIFEGMADDTILYSGCTGSMTGIVTIPPTPTTTGSSSNNTTRPPTTNTPTRRPGTSSPDPTATSGTSETQPSYAVIAGAGTTSVLNDKIGVNITYDQGILDQFSMSEAEFNSRALLLIPKDFYSSLAGSNNTVMLSARYSPIKVTSQQISSAVSNISKFSKYDAAHVQTITMDMGLLIGDTQTAIPFSSDEYQLQVRLPVPAGMKNCDVLAVAYTNETSLGTPTEVKVKDGYLEFAVQQLGTFTILGFSKDSGTSSGGIPAMILVLLIVGVLMLIGAGLLIYFFVIRKPKDDDDDLPPDDGGDLPDGSNDGGPDSPMPIAPDGYEPILPIPDAEDRTAGSIPIDPRTDTVPLNSQTAAAEPRDIFSSDSRDIYSSDSRDIYSSASRQPAPAPRARAEDVTLGAYRSSKGAEHAAPKKRTKKDPSDYDIQL